MPAGDILEITDIMDLMGDVREPSSRISYLQEIMGKIGR